MCFLHVKVYGCGHEEKPLDRGGREMVQRCEQYGKPQPSPSWWTCTGDCFGRAAAATVKPCDGTISKVVENCGRVCPYCAGGLAAASRGNHNSERQRQQHQTGAGVGSSGPYQAQPHMGYRQGPQMYHRSHEHRPDGPIAAILTPRPRPEDRQKALPPPPSRAGLKIQTRRGGPWTSVALRHQDDEVSPIQSGDEDMPRRPVSDLEEEAWIPQAPAAVVVSRPYRSRRYDQSNYGGWI